MHIVKSKCAFLFSKSPHCLYISFDLFNLLSIDRIRMCYQNDNEIHQFYRDNQLCMSVHYTLKNK